jgi:glycosyltransferase involved in cell wall biosynthesis
LEPWKLFPRLLRENCSVYHLLIPELVPIGLILKVLFRRQVLFDAHEDYVQYVWVSPYVKGVARYICAWSFRALLNLASRIFDGFVFGDDSLESEYPHLGARKLCFHHYALLSMFSPNLIPFAQRTYDLVYSGSISKDAGAFVMLEAVRLLRRRYSQLRVLFVGEPRRYIRNEFYRRIKEYGLEECIEITGRVPYQKVPGLLNQCKVGLIGLLDLPKFQKQSSTKLFEYMAKEVPVVSVDLAPERKYLIPGIHGYLVKPQEPQAMADAVYDIIARPDLGEQMAKACRKRVVENKLYAENECDKLLSFYTFILANPRRCFCGR